MLPPRIAPVGQSRAERIAQRIVGLFRQCHDGGRVDVLQQPHKAEGAVGLDLIFSSMVIVPPESNEPAQPLSSTQVDHELSVKHARLRSLSPRPRPPPNGHFDRSCSGLSASRHKTVVVSFERRTFLRPCERKLPDLLGNPADVSGTQQA
jgi:hypothetical protein